MSIQIITSAWNYFHKIPKQNFTEIIIHAMAMTDLSVEFNKKDLERLKWLRDNTHTQIKQSMFVLDRYVDETKGSVSNKNITFASGKTYNQDNIQKLLCIAIGEVYQIIYKNFKGYKVEEKLDLDDEQINSTDGW